MSSCHAYHKEGEGQEKPHKPTPKMQTVVDVVGDKAKGQEGWNSVSKTVGARQTCDQCDHLRCVVETLDRGEPLPQHSTITGDNARLLYLPLNPQPSTLSSNEGKKTATRAHIDRIAVAQRRQYHAVDAAHQVQQEHVCVAPVNFPGVPETQLSGLHVSSEGHSRGAPARTAARPGEPRPSSALKALVSGHSQNTTAQRHDST